MSRKSIRQEILKNAADHPDKLIILKLKELNSLGVNWLHSKEFIFQDEMYDVIKREMTADGEILYCMKDGKEKKLIAQFFEDFCNGKNRNSLLDKIVKLISNQFDINDPNYLLTFQFYANNNFIYKSLDPKPYHNSIFRPPQILA